MIVKANIRGGKFWDPQLQQKIFNLSKCMELYCLLRFTTPSLHAVLKPGQSSTMMKFVHFWNIRVWNLNVMSPRHSFELFLRLQVSWVAADGVSGVGPRKCFMIVFISLFIRIMFELSYIVCLLTWYMTRTI